MPLGALLWPWGSSTRPPSSVHAPSYACAPSLCIRALGSFKPLEAHIYVPWKLNYSPWGSIIPLGAQLCSLGVKCVAPFKRTHPPMPACVRPPPRRACPTSNRVLPHRGVRPSPQAPPSSSLHPSVPSPGMGASPYAYTPRLQPCTPPSRHSRLPHPPPTRARPSFHSFAPLFHPCAPLFDPCAPHSPAVRARMAAIRAPHRAVRSATRTI
jgi:hypothetical protein